jgi:hypothetical protein
MSAESIEARSRRFCVESAQLRAESKRLREDSTKLLLYLRKFCCRAARFSPDGQLGSLARADRDGVPAASNR